MNMDLWMEYTGRREEVEVENEWVKVMLGVRRMQEAAVESCCGRALGQRTAVRK